MLRQHLEKQEQAKPKLRRKETTKLKIRSKWNGQQNHTKSGGTELIFEKKTDKFLNKLNKKAEKIPNK